MAPRFSVTVSTNASIRAAIAAIGDATPGRLDQVTARDLGSISWAPGSPTPRSLKSPTAFASKKGQDGHRAVDGTPGPGPEQEAAARQDAVGSSAKAVPRSVFTDSPAVLLQAEGQHRDQAVVEQVFAEPSPAGRWLICRPGSSPRTQRGWRLRPWRTISSAPPALWPARRSQRPGPRPSAGTSLPSRPVTARHGRGHITPHLPEGWHREPGMAEPPRPGLRAARRSGLTGPRPGQHPDGLCGHPLTWRPSQTPDKPRNSASGEGTHAPIHLAQLLGQESDQKRLCR